MTQRAPTPRTRKRPHPARRSRLFVGAASAVAGVALVGTMQAAADTSTTVAAGVSADGTSVASTTTTSATVTQDQTATSSSAQPSSSVVIRRTVTSSHGS